MASVDPSAPTDLDPRIQPERTTSSSPEDTVERLMGQLLRELPMRREPAELAAGPGEEVRRENRRREDAAERPWAKVLREVRAEGAKALTPTDPTRGLSLGRFIVLGTLGRGGMGTVLRAYDEKLDRKIAIKVLHAGMGEQYRQRLLREAQALAKLSHPNVVQVYEVGEVEDQVFIAMELVKGEPLDRWQAQERSWWECVNVYLEAGQGLAAAHAAGLVHRDFKPGNCIVDEHGRVRVLDFGLAREVKMPTDEALRVPRLRTVGIAEGLSLTRPGTVMGTVAYMPPEQMQGQTADERADQFSFCVSLYEAVYGKRPFEGRMMLALMNAAANGNVRPAPKGSKVPAKLRGLLLRGLAAEPGQRWSSMDALLEELGKLAAPRRRWRLGAGVTAGLIASGAGQIWGWRAEVPDHCITALAASGDFRDSECVEAPEIALQEVASSTPDTGRRVTPQCEDHTTAWSDEHAPTGFDPETRTDGSDSDETTTNEPLATSDTDSETNGSPNEGMLGSQDGGRHDASPNRTSTKPLAKAPSSPVRVDRDGVAQSPMFLKEGIGDAQLSNIWVPNTQDGTLSKINTATLKEEGRYYTQPDHSGAPSGTSVSLTGNVAVANLHGGLTKFYVDIDDCRGTETSVGSEPLSFNEEDCMAWHTSMRYATPQYVVVWTLDYSDEVEGQVDEKVWTSGSPDRKSVEVALIDGETGVIEETTRIPSVPANNFGIYSAAADSEGNFWGLAVGSGWLVTVDVNTLEARTWPTEGGKFWLTIDHEGYVWTCSNTVTRFDPTSEIWTQIDADAIGGCVADGETLWLAGDELSGINRKTFVVERSFSPLPNNVHGIGVDSDGYVWVVSMDDSAYRVDPETGDVETVGALIGPYAQGDMTGSALRGVLGGREGERGANPAGGRAGHMRHGWSASGGGD